jgi:hypothetical protein
LGLLVLARGVPVRVRAVVGGPLVAVSHPGTSIAVR